MATQQKTHLSPAAVGTDYDRFLERILDYGPDYGGGLSNHGPMALEALASLGFTELYSPFVDHYVARLERSTNRSTVEHDWRSELANQLPELVAVGASQAGHGLLRVAHAVRALERHDTPTRRRELAAATSYWRSGRPLVGPHVLTGTRSLVDVVADLPRLENVPEGFLTRPLLQALSRADVMELIDSIQPADDPADRFDRLALLAADAMVDNKGLSAFGLLHGVTVSTMARELIRYLDEQGTRILEARVVAFVMAAVVGLDRGDPPTEERKAIAAENSVAEVDDLARELVRSLDEHDIKFAEAASGLFQRTRSPVVLDAMRARRRADF